MKKLHLDIETAPNTAHVWGLFKQNVGLNQLMESSYILSWSAKWHGEKGIIFDSVWSSSEEDMLHHIWSLLDEADAVIHYYGKKFDIPTLNKEFLLHGMPPPSPYHQIDLKEIAAKKFMFPSNKLDYVAKALGLSGKVSHEGHSLWVKCMEGDPVAQKKMEKYNKQDVVLLEKVYERLLPWITSHPNHALYVSSDRPVCPNCGSHKLEKRGTTTTKVMTYQRYQCKDCSTWVRDRLNNTPKDQKANIKTQVAL